MATINLPCLFMIKKRNILNLVKGIIVGKPIDEKYYDYADVLAPYGVALRYPNELFLEERHADKAVQMANEFVEVWRSEDIEVLVLNYLTKKYFKQEVKRK